MSSMFDRFDPDEGRPGFDKHLARARLSGPEPRWNRRPCPMASEWVPNITAFPAHVFERIDHQTVTALGAGVGVSGPRQER